MPKGCASFLKGIRMSDFRRLNPDDFKRWIKKHEDEDTSESSFVGMRADPKFCGKKTARSIVLEAGRAGRVVREFVQEGGLVKSVDGDDFLIEVKSGSFYINKKNIIF